MLNNEELNRQVIKIRSLINESKQRFEPDDELQSHLAKYICVICSGFLENAMYHSFHDIIKTETDSQVMLSYVKANLLKIQNPNCEKIKAIVRCFSNAWHDKLTAFMQQNERSSAINYIIKDRHNIAHGKDSNITISQIEIYFNKIVEVFVFIENELIVEENFIN